MGASLRVTLQRISIAIVPACIHACVAIYILYHSLFRICLIMNHGTILEQNCRGAAREVVIPVFVRDCLIMNHGTILEQNCRGAAREVVIPIFVRDCLIMNHGTILEQNCRGGGT